MSLPSGSRRSLFYDKIHKFSIYSLIGVGCVTFVLLGYNVYLFRRDGVPMLIDKYRSKAEEDIEKKQREAEYFEQRSKADKELLNDKFAK